MAPGTPLARTVRRILAWSGGIVLAIVAAVAIVLYVAAETPWGHERVRRVALHVLSGAVHGTVRIGALHGDLLHDVVVTDVSITDSSGAPFVSARRAEVHYSIRDLLHKHLDFRVSVRKLTESGTSRVTLSTAVSPHNLFGKAYLFVIQPFQIGRAHV